MKAHIYDVESLRAIPPAAVVAYIRFQGWHATEQFGDHSDVYIRNSGNEIILPRTQYIDDYAAVMSTTIERLAIIENRDEIQIYNDLVMANSDVVRVRAPTSDDDGSIDIDSGVELVTKARDMLLSAACSAHDPRASYRAGKIKEASRFMERVRLGQTERGSFIVSLLSPVPPALDQQRQGALWPVVTDEPYERMVTRVLANALGATKNAVEIAVRGDGIDAFKSAVPQGVSANLCEALAGLVESSGEAEISITWAKTRPTPEQRRKVAFSKDDGAILREVAREFRSAEPKVDETFEAFVIKLDRREDVTEGMITLRSLIDGQIISVRSRLAEQQYAVALAAHNKRTPLSINGDLIKRGHRWWLENPRSLAEKEISDDDDEVSEREVADNSSED